MPDEPDHFLDLVDWIHLHIQREKAIASLLCWVEHSLSEEEIHQLSVLLEYLAEDLERQINEQHELWRQTRHGRQ